MLTKLYNWMMEKAAHPHAERWLFLFSFIESSFFPIPPHPLLGLMCLAEPSKAMRFGVIATLSSVAGGLFGYLIGYFAFDLIEGWLRGSSYWGAYEQAVAWFDAWGFWAIFVAGFSPIPYKVFTIAAGVAHMALLPFVLASLIGRGGRFFLVAGLMAWGGPRMEAVLRKYVDRLGWATVAAVVVGVLIYRA